MFSLVDRLKNKGVIKSNRVEATMMAVDRGNYAPSNPYVDSPQRLFGFGVTISAPHMHAVALEQLADNLKEGMSCLDVGSGSGYLTACMARMVGRKGRTVGIDLVEQLTEFSRDNLRKDQPQLLQSIVLVTGDGSLGYPPMAPYDAIHVGAAADGVPKALHEQLKPGGRMIIPVGPQGGTQYLEQHDKMGNGRVVVKRLMGVKYGSLVCKEVKKVENEVKHAPVIGTSDRRVQEAEKRAKEAEGRARMVEREKEVAIRERDEARRDREAAERAKVVALREKLEAVREKEATERAKVVAVRERQEAKREKEAAERAKVVAVREKEEAMREKEAAERAKELAEARQQESERVLEESDENLQQPEAYWAVERGEIQLTGEEIGRGGWATVSVAVFRGVHVAAKCVHHQIVSPHNIQLFKREMDMAARIRHPNLLLFIGATVQGEMVILTELMSTSLRRELEREYQLTPRLTISIGLDVAKALNYLHLMRPHPLIHRDISSANVLLESLPNSRWRAKVSDYGTVNLQRNLTTSNPGNPCYSAPEAYNPHEQSPKMDIFSFGALLVEMLAGELPAREERARLLRRIHHQPLLALIQRCLKERRQDRPNASDIITELDP